MTYIVKRGDTLSLIAARHNTTVAQLVALNQIANPNLIRTGQVLLINQSPVSYLSSRRLVGGRYAVIHGFRMPRDLPRRLVAARIPGTARPSALGAAADLVVNGGFFWAGYPLGPTVVDGQAHGYAMPGYLPVDLDRLVIYPDTTTPAALLAEGVSQAVPGYSRLVWSGRTRVGSVDAYLRSRHPRTALGWSASEVIIAVVDGRSPRSAGITLEQLAVIMRDMGCQEAVNLDGGGSSVGILAGVVVTSPSDGRERPVVTALAFGGTGQQQS